MLMKGNLSPLQCLTWADSIYLERPKVDVTEHFIEDKLDCLKQERALRAQ